MNIVFSPVEGIKKKFINHDEIVKETYNEPTILPVPDNAPNEVPRIVMESIGGHSQMTLTKEVLSLVTQYDNNFNKDWERCKTNLSEKMEVAYNLLESMEVGQYSFMGLVTTVIWDDITEDSAKYIYENLTKISSKNPVFDISCKVTYIVEDAYYVNISVANMRLFQHESIATNQPGLLRQQTANTIGITIDVNDRYAYNSKENYYSDPDIRNHVISITERVINNLGDFITKGEINQ